MARQRLIREDSGLPDDAVLVRGRSEGVVPGEGFDREVLIADAAFNHELFDYFGLSLWLSEDPWPLERLLREKLRRFASVALFTAGALRTTGLGLVPSGRVPHFDASLGVVGGRVFGDARATVPSAANVVDRFLAAPYTVERNPFYEQDPS